MRIVGVVPAPAPPNTTEVGGQILAVDGGTTSTEVRWFVPGNGPLLQGVPARAYIDSYRLDMLAEGVSVKRRAGRRAGVFVKLRSAVLTPVAIGGLRGTPESWARWEIGPLPETAEMVRVHKAISRRKGVEVAQLVLREQEWWSVAVRLRGLELPCLPPEIESHLGQRSADARCCSYPTWLGERLGRPILRSNGLASRNASVACASPRSA